MGGLTYAVLAILALWSCKERRPTPNWPWGTFFVASAGAVAVSVGLAYISATKIRSFCTFCMASYVINALLLLNCWAALRAQKQSVAGAVRAEFRMLVAQPRMTVSLVVSGIAVISLTELWIPAYWNVSKWEEQTKLPEGVNEKGQHWVGARSPSVTIVEFSDYECPHCRVAHKRIREFVAKYPDKVRLIHRHLPLDMRCNSSLGAPFHLHACELAEAAECASLAGRFWEMNDALFAAQETRSQETLDVVAIADKLGLPHDRFVACLESDATLNTVQRDVADALALRLDGTPSYVVRDRVYLGNAPLSELEQQLTVSKEQLPETSAFSSVHGAHEPIVK